MRSRKKRRRNLPPHATAGAWLSSAPGPQWPMFFCGGTNFFLVLRKFNSQIIKPDLVCVQGRANVWNKSLNISILTPGYPRRRVEKHNQLQSALHRNGAAAHVEIQYRHSSRGHIFFILCDNQLIGAVLRVWKALRWLNELLICPFYIASSWPKRAHRVELLF